MATVDVDRAVVGDGGVTPAGDPGPVENAGDAAGIDIDESRQRSTVAEARVGDGNDLGRPVESVTVGNRGADNHAPTVLVVLLPQDQVLHACDVEHVRDRVELRGRCGHLD